MASISATGLVSATYVARVAVTVQNLPSLPNTWVGWGVLAGSVPPATYGAMSSTANHQPMSLASFTASYGVNLDLVSYQFDLAAIGAAGNHLWFCLFNVSPVGGSVPIATAPFITVLP